MCQQQRLVSRQFPNVSLFIPPFSNRGNEIVDAFILRPKAGFCAKGIEVQRLHALLFGKLLQSRQSFALLWSTLLSKRISIVVHRRVFCPPFSSPPRFVLV